MRPASGPAWRSGSAAVASPRSRARCASSSSRRSTTRCGRRSPRHPSWRWNDSSTSWPTPRGPSGDRPAVVAAILGLVSATEPVATTIDDASQAAALRAWALLRPLGSLASTAGVGATSRAWFEELRLAPAVADSLRGRGVDEAGAWGAAERVRLLLDLPLPSTVGGKADGLPLRLVDAWLADAVVRSFLRINRWDDADWFNRESWLELLAWTDHLERALTPAEARVKRPVERSVLMRRLAEAGEASGYRVDALREALEAGAAGTTPRAGGSPSRLPKATGLPPGPKDEPRAGDDHEAPKRPPTP